MQKKKWVVGVTAASLAAVVAIGATLAYFTSQTQSMTNDFTVANGGENVTGEIREPGWDGYDFGELNNNQEPDGKTAKDPDDVDLGINQAKKILPGDAIPKDPQLKNTSDIPVLMAIKVTYDQDTVNAIQDGIVSLDFDHTNWKQIDEADPLSDIYYWAGEGNVPAAVEADGTTGKLFTTVTIDKDADADTLTDLQISVQGGVVQAKNVVGTDNAVTELQNVFAAAE